MSLKEEPLIIVGMHRSGTSMLTRLLQDSGLFMGDKRDINDESLFFLKVNNWLFKEANATWDNPFNFKFIDEFYKENVLRASERRLNSFFKYTYFGFNKSFSSRNDFFSMDFKWGWKDPKNSFTIELWKEIYPKAKVLHIYRNPIDVAASLQTRARKKELKIKFNSFKEFLMIGRMNYNNSYRVMNLEEGFSLWTEYVEASLSIDGALHICYEELLENPRDILCRIYEFLEMDYCDEMLKKYIEKIDKSRKFSFINDEQLVRFYNTKKNDPLLKRLGYDKIV